MLKGTRTLPQLEVCLCCWHGHAWIPLNRDMNQSWKRTSTLLPRNSLKLDWKLALNQYTLLQLFGFLLLLDFESICCFMTVFQVVPLFAKNNKGNLGRLIYELGIICKIISIAFILCPTVSESINLKAQDLELNLGGHHISEEEVYVHLNSRHERLVSKISFDLSQLKTVPEIPKEWWK